nr:hypothetical protein [Bradyrhizobium sp. 2]
MSVVGFSDEPGFRWWGPGLTTISVPNAEITTACGLWLIHQMKQGASAGAASPYGSVTPGKLVVRAARAASALIRSIDAHVTESPRARDNVRASDPLQSPISSSSIYDKIAANDT